MRNRGVAIWLACVWWLICAMVLIGGTTRLTGSGLSMVEWRPLMGVLPPLTHDAWQAVFAKYQQSPQYLHVNSWMTLGDFKSIFVWEYCHRLLGRLIGVAFFVPWIVFVLRGSLRGRLARRTALAFVFGGAQGLLGWIMVKSGLVDVPSVSHYRLAAHLGLALFVACWILWILLDLRFAEDGSKERETDADLVSRPRMVRASVALLGLVSLQCIYGAFMAGTHAGYLFDTFPTMNGQWIPSGLLSMSPLSHPTAIHFIHRTLAWLVVIGVILCWWQTRRGPATSRQIVMSRLLLGGVALQFSLGICTVVFNMPIAVAVAHQGGGVLLLSLSVANVHAWLVTRGKNPTVTNVEQ